jgi:hypothetical protein
MNIAKIKDDLHLYFTGISISVTQAGGSEE